MSKRAGRTRQGVSVPGSERRGARTDKAPPVAAKSDHLRDPTVCDMCGAVYTRKTWRHDHKITHDLLEAADWALCPACDQGQNEIAYGRILLMGSYVAEHEEEIRRRIDNVGSRAGHTQPQRRVISIEWDGNTLEVLATSQKLAHRIVKELKKAFGGQATYDWASNDGTLFATWQR